MEYRQTDGRMQRSERTRALIVQAHADLLREGVLKPTAALIAERAGVSRRTLWSNFRDMESLLGATVEYWFRADDELRTEIEPGAPLEDRILRFCAERERRLVNIAPAARAAVLGEPDYEALRASRHGHIARVRSDVKKTFAPELAASASPEVLIDSLTAATSWNLWSLMFDDHGYPADRCRRIMEMSVRALLQG
ncbi:TetR/AcrR family transcriptional regulator [Aeromicrobium duanguangcaii]|uniref:TetR/AcrR family transcriptional regulator n=2 Tax=Aeromicrobium duanguangcaii TaxID=2968086 RepID=A0ABY5KHY0_9ACTN|nr:TetR/AcrR family transcriptional regulator [Aeromicrobium duanguangcaii]MCD9154422.1 TetR/AcrR family transcriptional regulator [Aeromicrobium duanguangcaii]UUI70084.1 TetR/AcrR family transcriptional regulator [Aeromicrobium duanguangcaii]